MTTDDDDTDDDTHTVIGRRGSVSVETRIGGADGNRKPPRAPSPPPPASSSDGSKVNGHADAKYAAEAAILMSALAYAAQKLQLFSSESPLNDGLPIELYALIFASLTHIVWNHSSCTRISPLPTAMDSASPDPLPTLRLPESRVPRRGTPISNPPVPENRGYVWMTVPKNYRISSDDGLISGLILGPLITSALYYIALKSDTSFFDGTPQPPFWHIEVPWRLTNETPLTPLQALVLSRRNAVDLGTLCSPLCLFMCMRLTGSSGAIGSSIKLPRANVAQSPVASHAKDGYMSYWEIASGSVFFQLSLYIAVRLAHRGFTLGELGLVVFGATALFTELVNLTVARIWPVTTLYIKTYRLPTPLLIFQLALIPGSLLTGFLLSPLLTLSRHIAQRPVRRLRFPHEKQARRRSLAVGFYLGAALIVGGLIGMWTRWLLRGRDPWLWVIFWQLEGPSPWTRPALLVYWAVLGSISVWGWNRQLARSRRFRPRLPMGSEPMMDCNGVVPSGSEPATPASGALALAPSSLTSSAVSSASSAVSAMFPTVAMPHIPTDLGLGAIMFVPGVAADPAFTHLAFSAAFALLCCGVRCAGALWFEAPSRLLMYTGILTVGVGDAVASTVGKRVGRYKWSPTTPKTLEGAPEDFSVVRYGMIIGLGSVLEAMSGQNDNIILPVATIEGREGGDRGD
ncbi:hypothetical protein B0F90DRAFT_1669493 [Multifurca ochricompacta]|uniref:dolichol kinase n=1 Tax=Multifurca ochricompacta TaxID=376703 RepID=A0AAD4M2E3_9AGAM|nr:hypothetical protein B0F90DRAFT_1669493 [Multifurca ochricompacta]